MRKILCFLFCIIFFQTAFSQLPDNNLELLIESAKENSDPDEIIQQLQRLKNHPLNLNNASMAELTVPGLFSQLQAEEIARYRNRYGTFIAFEELQAIRSLSMTDLMRMKNYCVVQSAINRTEWKPGNLFSDGKHTLLYRSRVQTGNTDNFNYPGDNSGHSFSWRYTKSDLLDIGINGDKDPGETYLKKKGLPVMDSWNYHIFLKPGGWIRSVAIGDYQVNCGQGLITWTGFAGSKGPDVVNVRKLGQILRPYSSFGEYNNYRGVAVNAGTDKANVSAWFSNKSHDSDLEGNYFSTVNVSGLHRSEREIISRSNLKRTVFGVNARLKGKSLVHEITVQRSRYDANQTSGDEPYQHFNPQGSTATHAGYSYYALLRSFSLAGEIATDNKGSIAYLNTALFSIDPKVVVSILHRHLPASYTSFSADPFRENSNPLNEQGFYAGVQWQIFHRIKCSFYADHFRFPWLKYGVDRPSEGMEWFVQLNWTPSRNSEIYIRLRKQSKEENPTGSTNTMRTPMGRNQSNLRADARLKLSGDLFYQSRVEWTRVITSVNESSDGWLMFQEIDLKPMGKSWSFTIRCSAYSTDSYDTRIYAFEQELPGSFSLPAFYGSGNSTYILHRRKLFKGVDIWLRIGTEKSSGPGSVRIWSPGIQVRWIFT